MQHVQIAYKHFSINAAVPWLCKVLIDKTGVTCICQVCFCLSQTDLEKMRETE